MLPLLLRIASPGRLAACLFAALGAALPARSADFNGDGISDLLFRDRSEEGHRLLLLTGGLAGVISTRSIYLGPKPEAGRGYDVRTADFNGDGRSDVLSRDLASGITRIRLMDGKTIQAQGDVADLPQDVAEELISTADFNGDGRADLLYRNRHGGTWSVYLMNALAVDLAASGPTDAASAPNLHWISSADFDGDGRADLLLRNTATLTWVLQLMDGRRVLENTRPRHLPLDPAWQLQGVADFNRDARADLLMRHRETGKWFAWHLDGGSVLQSSGRVALNENLAMRLVHLGDLNGDAYPDVLLQRPDNGRVLVQYLVEHSRLSGSGALELPVEQHLRIASVEDFDGDGAPEILATGGNTWSRWDFRELDLPLKTGLELGSPTDLPWVCDPPNYYQYGVPNKPADATARTAYLTWITPSTRENGEALCAHELAGFHVSWYSTRPKPQVAYYARINDPRADAFLTEELDPRKYFFRILSIDYSGFFSQSSETISKTIR